jgi:hypothetical protein
MTRAERQQEWEIRIAAYRTSGLSVQKWCVANGLQPYQLWYWLRRNSPETTSPAVKSTRWLPVEMTPVDHDDALVIRIGTASIEVRPGFDPALLSGVVRALSGLC